ncbi:MAG TPA: hypothetical protein VFQ58_05080 [Flavisolibacter sp.]|jgi:hypothetical protein|nr:hypothetical protein [Flavisolibacter sp.]
MDINFNYCTTEEIANLLSKADYNLHEALLKGDDWKDIKEKRRIYTELSIALHRRQRPQDFGDSPADIASRKHDNKNPR